MAGVTDYADQGYMNAGLELLMKKIFKKMEKIGMQRDVNGDFAHPKLSPDHKLSKHVLYRIKRTR